jgi:tRNA/tmRNA/rRNA uracil-C5-methylase (TrmA/RlmC/RlmD family)
MDKKSSDEKQIYSDPEHLQKALYQLLEQISKRDQKILSITAEKAAVMQELMEKEKVIAEKDANLLFWQSQFRQVVDSRAWKMASSIQNTRTLLAPPESRRAQFIEKLLSVISPAHKKSEKN